MTLWLVWLFIFHTFDLLQSLEFRALGTKLHYLNCICRHSRDLQIPPDQMVSSQIICNPVMLMQSASITFQISLSLVSPWSHWITLIGARWLNKNLNHYKHNISQLLHIQWYSGMCITVKILSKSSALR